MIHIIFLASFDVHFFRQAQIALLKADKTLISTPSEYVDFANIFFSDLAAKLLEYIKINNYTIN